MGSTARAFWILAPGESEVRDEPLATPGGHDALVRTSFSALSRGTESLVWRGEVPETEHERMRAPFQVGDFPGPLKYGYVAVGRVEAGPEGLVGENVFCLHPHQDRFVVPADRVTPIPAEVPPERAVLAANLETAINGLWDARPLVGERIAVVGAGVLGCLVAWLAARIPGTCVELIDVQASRRGIATTLGTRFALPDDAAREADLVVHASGSPAGLETALELAGLEGRVVEMSWFGDREVRLPLGRAFHSRRLRILSSQVGRVSPNAGPRWSSAGRLQLALDLLRDPRLDALITGEDAFEDLPRVLPRIADDAHTLCHRIRYDA